MGGTGDGETTSIGLARSTFLDEHHVYGCAETVFIVLKDAFDLDDPTDSSAAMALNGGIAWTGGPCGAVTGAALAIGMLAGRRCADHARAKVVARELVADLLAAFIARYGTFDCRSLIGTDLRAPGSHAAFLAGGAWREACMGQIEFVVGAAAPLGDATGWAAAVESIDRRLA